MQVFVGGGDGVMDFFVVVWFLVCVFFFFLLAFSEWPNLIIKLLEKLEMLSHKLTRGKCEIVLEFYLCLLFKYFFKCTPDNYPQRWQ